MQELIMIFTNSLKDISIWSIIDILIVAFIFYRGYILIKETRAEQLLKGVILLLILIPISYVLRLQMLNFILTKTLTIGVLSIIIIFQPEIRRALEHIGSTAFDDFHVIQDDQKLEEVIDQLIVAVEDMAETKTGWCLNSYRARDRISRNNFYRNPVRCSNNFCINREYIL